MSFPGGFLVFDATPETRAWATAANRAADAVLADPEQRAKWLRHNDTWFVGVDSLPNDARGTIDGVPLPLLWEGMVPGLPLHPAQLSVVFPGYPGKDADAFRVKRDAAHVDGLMAEGNGRYLREPHAYVAGIALTEAKACPLVVWPGSDEIMREAFTIAFAGLPPSLWSTVDIAPIYKDARAEVFECCERVELPLAAGQVVLMDRMLVHGTAPQGKIAPPKTGRRIALFRPQFDNLRDWVRAD